MNEELLKIAQYKIPKLPESVRNVFLSDKTTTSLSEIKTGLGLSEDQGFDLNTEIMFLLLGLSSPKEFPQTLKEDLVLNEMLLKTLLRELDEKILEPIYPDLVRFYEQEQAERVKMETEANKEKPTEVKISAEKEILQKQEPTPAVEQKGRQWEKVPDVAPDNLPTEQEFMLEQSDNSFIPKLTPKTTPQTFEPQVVPEETPHPFEEKMQKVFTAGAPAMENFELENAVKEKPKSVITTARPAAHDPYREPIE